MHDPRVEVPHVVILGCGFGGLAAARALARAAVRITLIDRVNHHLFQPLLYQVATASLSAPAIAAPIRHILARQRNATVLLGEVDRIDADRREVVLVDGPHPQRLQYDYLIVATGATHNYFGHEDWARVAPGLKTLADAFDIRARVLLAFEYAERETDIDARRAWLTFAVVGGGATGVELAGALAEIARHTLRAEFRHIDTRQARIVILEGSDRLLPPYAPDLSEKARRQLVGLGAEVLTGCRVTHVDGAGLSYESGAGGTADSGVLRAHTVLWAAGVAASPLGRALGAPVDNAGRVRVEPDLSVPGRPEVFVVGDLAYIENGAKPVPGVAPAAKQMGRWAARNLLRRQQGESTLDFVYRNYGSLATIGRGAAIAEIGRLKLSGLPAWLFWLFVHILFLIGFRNRLVVLADWAWAYITFERHARIVAGVEPKPPGGEAGG